MSLPNYLAKIKSAGIYRFVWDKSQVSATEAETLRLVVGYSDKGPFNTPVYIDNPGDFKTTFGDVNKKLERRGVFFHRMALQALTAGPILALNLKKFGNEKVSYIAAESAGYFDVKEEELVVDVKATDLIKAYDIKRFWSLDPDNLQANYGEDDKYIVITAADSKEASNSIFMRGMAAPASYNVTIKTWYDVVVNEDIPEYFEGYEDMLVSDFFAEIYVFKGQFTPALASGEELKRYFNVDGNKVTLKKYVTNAFGEKVDTLVALSGNECSNFVQRYQGILLPYFKNTNGSYISLDLLFNNDVAAHKMMMKLNGELLDNGKLNPKDISTRGWDKVTEKVLTYALDPEAEDATPAYLHCFSNMSIVPTIDVATYGEEWVVDSPADYSVDADLLAYGTETEITTEKGTFTCPTEYKDAGFVEGDRFLVKVGGEYVVSTLAKIEEGEEDVKFTFANEDAEPISQDVVDGPVWPEDAVEDGESFVAWATDVLPDGFNAEDAYYYNEENTKVLLTVTEKTTKSGKTYAYVIAPVGVEVFASLGDDTDPNKVVTFPVIVEGGAWVKLDAQGATTAIKAPSKKDRATEEETKSLYFLIKCNHVATELIAEMSPIYLPGYERDASLAKPADSSCESKLAWQKAASLNAAHVDKTIGYPGLVEALTNRTDIDYRYIVDTFESFVDSECKASLAALAKKKDNCLLLTNFPAVSSFVKCKVSTFVDETGTFQSKYVVEGANRKKSAAVLFSLPSVDNGASWCSFNSPVIFTDGTVKTVVPAAALVSNNFMEKYNSRQPYYIVAGPNYGRLSYTGLVGPDFNYSQADRDLLEPFGVNCTVYVPRKGTYISSNQTAKQTPVTALSKINVRELVIYLQDQIEDLLQNYQWEFNTQTLRDLIKKKADTICENVKYNGGIHDFENQCDGNNNDEDVINNEMLVLSTAIEPGMGAGKMVQELTIYKRGGLRSVIK